MFKKITIGNSDGIIINDSDIKSKLIDYLYNAINLSKLRYTLLDNIQKLKFLKDNEHFVSLNLKGNNYFFVFITIKNINYAVLINRKKLSYNKNQLDMKSVFIIRITINTNLNIYSGTIFDGKIINKDNNHSFLIHDCYYLMGKKIMDMEMVNKLNYLNDIINANFSDVCSNFSFKLNTIYTYDKLHNIIYNIIPSYGNIVGGLIFIPKYTGQNIIYIDNNKQIDNSTVNIINNKENIETKSYDLIVNFNNILLSRTYSYEIEGKIKNLYLTKSDIHDVYNIYEQIDDNKIGIAHIPNLKISHYCVEHVTNTPKLFKCIFNTKFNKWIPLSII